MTPRSVMVALAATAAAALATPGVAKELTIGTYLPPSHYTTTHGLESFASAVKKESKGALTVKLFPGGQLYNAQRSLSGIGRGLSDGGLVVALFARSELRRAILLTDLMFATANPLVAAAASTETILLRCPECQQDYKKNGAVFIGGYSTITYSLLCKPDVRTLADVKGKRIRAVGVQGQLSKSMGGVPVSIPMTEAVEAMQRGAVDCIIGPLSWLTGYPGTDEVVKSILRYPFGLSSGLALLTMNEKSWRALQPAERKVILMAMPTAISDVMLVGTYGDLKKSENLATKRGIKVNAGGKDFADLVTSFSKSNENAQVARAEKLGVKNARQTVDQYKAAIAKWEKIMAKVGTDKAAYAKALADEIYSKVNPDKM